MTYTRPSATAGPVKPPDILVRQSTFGPSFGNESRTPVSRQTLSRFGPSHCGQSSARPSGASNEKTVIEIVNRKLSRMKDIPFLEVLLFDGPGCILIIRSLLAKAPRDRTPER